jgi:hypothetical protein
MICVMTLTGTGLSLAKDQSESVVPDLGNDFYMRGSISPYDNSISYRRGRSIIGLFKAGSWISDEGPLITGWDLL